MNSNSSSTPIRKWFVQQSLDHTKRTIIISIIATLIMGSGLQFFVIDDDMMKMLPKNLESRIAWDMVQEEFGSTDVIFISFGKKGQTVFHPNAFSALWDISVELEALHEIEEVQSISMATRMDNYDGFMEIDDLQSDRELMESDVHDIKVYLDKNPNLKDRFVSQNEDYLVAIVQPFDGIGLDQVRNELVAVVDPILQDYDVHYGGTAYVTGTIPGIIRNDVKSLIKAGLFIMILILLLNLRSVPGVAMVLMVIGLSFIAMMGFLGWVYKFTGSDRFLFTLVNTSMPIILLTIANSDGVHVVTKFFREMRLKGDVRNALITTMDSLLVPIFLTSITTVAAFLTMIFAPLEPMIGYGISISVGIIWAWLLSSLMLPAVISLKKWDLESKAISEPSAFEKIIDRLGQVVLTHPKYIFSLGLIFVSIGVFGFFKVTVDVNFAHFFKPGTEIRDSMDFMDEEMTGTMDIRARVEGDMKSSNALNDMVTLQEFMEKNENISLSYSIADIVKQMHRTIMDDDPAFETIPESREKVNNLFTMYSMSGDPDDFSSMVDYDYNTGLITALSKIMSTEEIFSYVGEVNTYIDEKLKSDVKIHVTGMIVVLRDMILMIIKSSALSIIFSLILIGVISAIFFKRILWGLLAVVPLSSAVILNFGLMGHFNITLNHITAILSSIIIGVGVDFAVHYIAQFRRLSRTVDQSILSREVMDDVGYPIILDAGSNMGFGALLFSAFIPIQYIGGLMVFAMISTSLGTLTILSALSELLKKRLITRKNIKR